MKVKRILAISGIILIIGFTSSIVSFFIDSNRVDNNQKPLFIIHKDHMNDGGSTIYYGLGYQLITWKRMIPEKVNVVGVGLEKHYLFGFNRSNNPNVELTEISG